MTGPSVGFEGSTISLGSSVFGYTSIQGSMALALACLVALISGPCGLLQTRSHGGGERTGEREAVKGQKADLEYKAGE